MNEFLAEIYNTREAIGAPQNNSDVEKLAEAQLLDEALQAEGVDIDTLPGETILKLAHELIGPDSALVKAASDEAAEGEKHEEDESAEHEEGEKEEHSEAEVKAAAIAELQAKEAAAAAPAGETEETFEEKVAQADFLGRLMAHSFYNEKTAIEKNAAMPAALKKGLEAAGKIGKDVGEGFKGLGHMARHPVEAARAAKESVKSQGVKGALKGSHKELKALGVGVAGAGGLAAGAKKAFGGDKKKKASALDMLAEKRAMEWAAAHGLLEQSDEEKLAFAVNQRAAEMLVEAGIDVAAVEAETQK